MIKLLADEYNALYSQSTLLVKDCYGDKLIELPDNTYLKLFRLKKIWSSALFYSYAKRFAENAGKIRGKDVLTVTIKALYNIPSIKRKAVAYLPLSGNSIREISLQQGGLSKELIARLGGFIAELHSKGIYFRSLHLGNIVLTNDNQLGLIDIADLRTHKKSLGNMKRVRNFSHLFRYSKDLALLRSAGSTIFIESYINAISNAYKTNQSSRLDALRTKLIKRQHKFLTLNNKP